MLHRVKRSLFGGRREIDGDGKVLKYRNLVRTAEELGFLEPRSGDRLRGDLDRSIGAETRDEPGVFLTDACGLAPSQTLQVLSRWFDAYRLSADAALLAQDKHLSPDSRRNTVLMCGLRGCDASGVIAAQLGVALAHTGRDGVAVIDCDHAQPSMHRIFGIGDEPGIASVAMGLAQPVEAIYRTGIPGLVVVPAGRTAAEDDPPCAREQGLTSVLRTVEDCGTTLVCTPPLLDHPDLGALARAATAVFLITTVDRGRRSDIAEAGRILASLGITAAGVIVARRSTSRSRGR